MFVKGEKDLKLLLMMRSQSNNMFNAGKVFMWNLRDYGERSEISIR